MVVFYRIFIHNFADISKALNKLTGESDTFRWNADCENAFFKLKECLCSPPILAFPEINEPFILEIDASDIAIGGVLDQGCNES